MGLLRVLEALEEQLVVGAEADVLGFQAQKQEVFLVQDCEALQNLHRESLQILFVDFDSLVDDVLEGASEVVLGLHAEEVLVLEESLESLVEFNRESNFVLDLLDSREVGPGLRVEGQDAGSLFPEVFRLELNPLFLQFDRAQGFVVNYAHLESLLVLLVQNALQFLALQSKLGLELL